MTADRIPPPPFTLADWPAEQIADPYPVYRRYRAAGAVQEGAGGYFVFGYQEVAQALASPRLGRRAPAAAVGAGVTHAAVADTAVRALVEDWLVFLDPPRHTRLRAVLSREFTPRVVAGLRARMAAIVAELLAGQHTIDLVADFAAPYPVLVISELLGLPRRDGRWLRECSLRLQQGSSSRAGRTPEAPALADAAARELTGYFHEQLAGRRARGSGGGSGGGDLIDLLLAAGELTSAEVVATCVHLLTAGHETTTHLITKSVLALLDRPELVALLRAEPALLPAAVEEFARYDPPVQAVTRWVQQDERLGAHPVPRGARVTLLLGAANRDPAHFERPDAVDPHRRTTGRQLAFGLGIHYCLGAVLARAETELALAALLGPLSTAELLERPVRYAADLVFHGPERLLLRW
ncbi:cytochrome P450 [Kitasatospora sp. NBC_01287]|uniref:cytochrome P450 n=1 Tax=Kitasatospora sp. NBC_01287 TaxID=2903573 RepID=UPI0022553485|nr:cytochrome P450 [Kitasatospora sp. NBC_01287]MCX4749998.1 cytochrome P450 [Kitasatospora sp. NBC_01287]